MSQPYANPDVLVSTEWVERHRRDTSGLRLVETNEDLLLYGTGHIPEAVHIDWVRDLNDPVQRNYIGAERFAQLCAAHGIADDTPVVFYGDKSNWWACYAFWVFQLYGHRRCAVMDGGRKKWKDEGRPMTRDVPRYPPAVHAVGGEDPSIRALREQVLTHMRDRKPLVDVRSPGEYRGEITHMPDYPQEGVLRGGHIPGARSKPWAAAVREDGTFKSRQELEAIYLHELGLRRDDDVIAYCRIGERSSHTWFVLKYLLGFSRVRNYDGSWTEWGNSVGLPIERGEPAQPPA